MTTKQDLVDFISPEKDIWWDNFVSMFNSYFDIESTVKGVKAKPNLIILDEGSYQVLMEKVEQYSAYYMLFNVELIKIPRVGKSEVRMYRRIL